MQARETRRLIAESARRLFIEHGNSGKPIEAIAQGAAVATESEILGRAAPIFVILKSAAETDVEIAELVQRLPKERLENTTLFVQHIARNNGLREGMSISAAAELVWTLASPEVFLLLTRNREYSPEKYAAWLQTTLTRLLLP